MKKLLLWNGRINRSDFFTLGFLLNVISAIMEAMSNTLPDNATASLVVSLLILAVFGLLGYIGLCLTIRRLHDLNQPGWMYLVFLFSTLSLVFIGESFIPPLTYLGLIIALGVTLILLFKKGTSGDNKYGPDPLALKVHPITEVPPSDSEQ